MAGEPLLRGVSFKLERRDRLTLSGRNGSGKTTLLRMLSGETVGRRRRARVRQGHAGGAARPAPAARARPVAARLRPRRRARSCSRSRSGWPSSRRRWPRARPSGQLDAYSRAQARLEHAGGYDWRDEHQRDAARARLPRRAPRPLARDVLRRRADARVAGAGARGRPRPAAARRADQPPRHRVARVARGAPADARRRRRARRPRPLVPRGGGHRVLELEGGRSKFFKGTWHAWRDEKAARELALGRAIEKQQAEIERLERFVDRFSAGTRARQAQSRAKKLEKMERSRATRATARPSASRSSRRSARAGSCSSSRTGSCRSATACCSRRRAVARARRARVPGRRERHRQDDADHRARRPARARRRQAAARPQRQARAALPARRGAPATAHGARGAQRATRLTPNKARALLGQFLFSGEDAEKPLDGLSGGERQRLSLAILVHCGANVLILDEPTNHLDLESREALEAALQQLPGRASC